MATNSSPKPEKRVSLLTKASSPKSKRSSKDSESQEARPYQLELLDAAIDEDTIVNLGTGAGKTFIAVMLIKELSSSILRPFGDELAKRSVFLVTTVPLVKQQAGYIRTHTCFDVGEFVGEMGVDSWSLAKWHIQFESYHVLVMTMTIFKNLVQQNFLPLKKVNLLVLDECHHAVKEHDYVQIMRLFKPHKEAGDEVPHVLGLTASLIPSKCKPGEIKAKIKQLEQILCCRSQTASDLLQVARYATDPEEVVLVYDSSDMDPEIVELKSILEDSVNFLDSFKKPQKESDIYSLVKLYIDDLLHLLENLGIWCADCFAKEGLRAMESELEDRGDHFVDEWEKTLLYLGRTRLKVFLKESAQKLQKARQRESYPTTNKVKKLAHYLGDSAVASGEFALDDSDPVSRKDVTKLLGIVFVERRTTAAMLNKLLKHLKDTESDLKHIRCDYVVGHNETKKGTYLRREATMSVKKQHTVLEKFRKGKINLLISTSVVEEGVDVPRCNNVVRFDFPQNLRAFIQSKGRARAKVSKYLILINSKEGFKQTSDLRDYRVLEKELKSICQDRHVPDDEAILKRMEELVGPYMPLGRDGPKATLGSSLSLVHKYCQKLPKDHYTILTPIFTTVKLPPAESAPSGTGMTCDKDQENEEPLFQSTLTLPMNSPLREPIEGLCMPTRRIAERSAALVAVQKLHEAGELDEHLRLLAKDDDSDVEDEEKMVARGVTHAGTEKRHDYYPNKVASILSGCYPVAGPGNHLYVFLIHKTDMFATLYQSLPGGPASTFGILTRRPIPHIKVPEFSLYDHDETLNVKIHKYHSTVADVTQEDLDTLKLCHEVLFTELLKINASWLHLTCESSSKDYLVVPLTILPHEEPLETFLDLDMARTITKLKCPSGSSFAVSNPRKAWPIPLECLNNAMVTDIHVSPDKRKLYEVLEIDRLTTPMSQFPHSSNEQTYGEYFQTKYDYPFTDFDQPALTCKALGLSDKRITLLKSLHKTNKGEDLPRRPAYREIKLFPELCSLYPIPANVWKLARCIPSVLWRLECILSIDEFRSLVALETRIGLSGLGDSVELITETHLHGYEDHGYGELLTQEFTTNRVGEVERHPVSLPSISLLSQRGPDNALLLQAFTPKGAKESFDLERLETLGDSFLKLVTTVFLFHDRKGAHEGRLSCARSRRVGNLNLFLLAKKEAKKITEQILSTSFEPRQMWIPPCFSFKEDDTDPSSAYPQLTESDSQGDDHDRPSARTRHYLFHKVSDKGVADCVESLIGAYLVAGGIDAGLKFMKWMGIKIQPETKHTDVIEDEPPASDCSRESGELTASSSSSSSSTPPVAKRTKVDHELQQSALAKIQEPKLPLYMKCSSTVFQKHFPPPPSPCLDRHQENEVEKLLDKSYRGNINLKKMFGQIKDRTLLLQALTHASYVKNRVTDCYQRLEFLGDAVLDYLVTCHIYSTFPNYNPGEISALRSALVNNNTFAELAVELELHKALLHNSPTLFGQIGAYVGTLVDVQKTEEVHQLIMTDSQVQDASGLESGSVNVTGTPALHTPSQQSNESDEDDIDELDPPKVLGDILESIAGAIFVDSGLCLESVWKIFRPLFEKRLASFNGKIPVLPVQELFEREPSAQTEKSRVHGGEVRCTITFIDKDGQHRKFSAKSRTFKAAKMAAARAAIREMNKE